MKFNEKLIVEWNKTYSTKMHAADRGMERDREMEISIQFHDMLIRQLNDQILMRFYIIESILCPTLVGLNAS